MKKQISRNQGRIEYIASKELIERLVEQGFDKKKIYDKLKSAEAITMSYATFCRKLSSTPTVKQQETVNRATIASPMPSRLDHAGIHSSAPRTLTSSLGKSTDPRDLDPNDAF